MDKSKDHTAGQEEEEEKGEETAEKGEGSNEESEGEDQQEESGNVRGSISGWS